MDGKISLNSVIKNNFQFQYLVDVKNPHSMSIVSIHQSGLKHRKEAAPPQAQAALITFKKNNNH